MSKLKTRLIEDLENGREQIVCCGASMFGGYFVDYRKRGNYTGIRTIGYSHVDEEDREFIKAKNIRFFDFAAIRDTRGNELKDLLNEHEALLKAECY